MILIIHHDSHDREHLAKLMADFPVAHPVDIEKATKLLHQRFSKLHIEQFSNALIPLNDIEFVEHFQSIPRKMHRYLFQGIVSNAGQYRNEHDPGNGMILFGTRQQYRGTTPANISNELQRACSQLKKNDSNPVSTIVKFYQEFVYIHPFYDANGRIGRFITTLCLDYHGFFISWKKIRQNQKWLKKLNACHKRIGEERYDFYLELLIEYWKQFIRRKEEIDPIPQL